MVKKKAIILGAGISGLSVAWKFKKEGYDVVIIEKDKRIGGLSGTIDWDGWKFDFGAHSFHSKNQHIINIFKQNLPDKFLPRKVNAKLYIFDRLMHYPIVGFQVFTSLKKGTMLLAGLDFLITRLKALFFGIKETDHLDEWIKRRFGIILYNAYFHPYLQRVQKKDVHLLSSDIGRKKIPIFSIRQYLLRTLTINKFIHPDEKILFDTYYIKGGFGELCRYFWNEMATTGGVRLSLDETVSKVSIQDGKVVSIETDKNHYSTESAIVVSTIPIKSLFRVLNSAEGLENTAEQLEYMAARYILMKVKKDCVSGTHWINFNGEQYFFTRVSEHIYDEFEMVPGKGLSSLNFEIPLNTDDEYYRMPDDEIFLKALDRYNNVVPLHKEDIIDYRSVWTDYAAPRMTLGYKNILKKLLVYLAGVDNIYSMGRQGLFSYMNADQCIELSSELVTALVKDSARDWYRQLIKTLHSFDIE
ncbi:MAG: FAD-dependent oxidoreductase [Elusimicrobia bacterium]|nr:FAD-dependent oxidoreductase [Elusimicrobiota bacterium]